VRQSDLDTSAVDALEGLSGAITIFRRERALLRGNRNVLRCLSTYSISDFTGGTIQGRCMSREIVALASTSTLMALSIAMPVATQETTSLRRDAGDVGGCSGRHSPTVTLSDRQHAKRGILHIGRTHHHRGSQSAIQRVGRRSAIRRGLKNPARDFGTCSECWASCMQGSRLRDICSCTGWRKLIEPMDNSLTFDDGERLTLIPRASTRSRISMIRCQRQSVTWTEVKLQRA
jgi:hypothetical protein